MVRNSVHIYVSIFGLDDDVNCIYFLKFYSYISRAIESLEKMTTIGQSGHWYGRCKYLAQFVHLYMRNHVNRIIKSFLKMRKIKFLESRILEKFENKFLGNFSFDSFPKLFFSFFRKINLGTIFKEKKTGSDRICMRARKEDNKFDNNFFQNFDHSSPAGRKKTQKINTEFFSPLAPFPCSRFRAK